MDQTKEKMFANITIADGKNLTGMAVPQDFKGESIQVSLICIGVEQGNSTRGPERGFWPMEKLVLNDKRARMPYSSYSTTVI